MLAHSCVTSSTVPLESVLFALAEARAVLVRDGLMDFYDAVDGLQDWAMRSGLVPDLGQDEVQAIIAHGFGGYGADVG